jgi:hypothetical protein
MIVLKLLNIDNFYSSSEVIEIAKGKYKLSENLKEGFKQVKRAYYEKRSN